MAFELESPAEAYAAVSLLAVGADGVGTLEERRFLFTKLEALGVFSDYDHESFGALLGSLTGRMYGSMPGDGATLSAESVSQVCAAVRDVLDAGQRGELFPVVVELACSDGLVAEERTFLEQIADELGVDDATSREILDRAAG